jgi:N-acetylneuraminic acid mutarotase
MYNSVGGFLLRFLLFTPTLFLFACGGGNGTTPPPSKFTIAGSVVNLAAGSGGVVLQDNGTDSVTVNANGNFQFATALASGSSYNVTVLTQPSNPKQTCGVVNGSGTANADVTNIKVDCGHNEWAWMTGSETINQIGTYGTLGTPAAGNTPGGRQYPATWTDKSGNLWLFGGYGPESGGTLLPFNDLWKFSGGEWTWMGGPQLARASGVYGTLGVASASNIPGARFEPASWADAQGNFWMFGGNGFDSEGNEVPMNDLWEYSNGAWTWEGGADVGPQQGIYGTLGVANSNNTPGGRNGAAVWLDASGDLWVFGGIGYDVSNPINGKLNDLWKYSGGEWTWMSGSQTKEQPGIYGTQGVASASNTPGAREGAYNWIDASGTLWLFGGYGYDSTGANSYLNDLWKYSAGQWTWVSGPNVIDQSGVYGTQGVSAANNIPGARWMGAAWTDASGNFWLFGGSAIDSTGHAGLINDLWKYSSGQWTWVSGATVVDQDSTFGTQGNLAPGNVPGGRFFLNQWVDTNGNFWLFGGYGETPGGTGNLNDLWMYEP